MEEKKVEKEEEVNALNTYMAQHTMDMANKDVEEVTTGLTSVTRGGIVLDYNYFMEVWYPDFKAYFFDKVENDVIYRWFLNYRDSSLAIVANYNPNVRNARSLEDYGTPLLILPPLRSEIKINMDNFSLNTIKDNSNYEITLPQRYDNVVKEQVSHIGVERDNDTDARTYEAWMKGLQHLNPSLPKQETKQESNINDLGFEY